MLVKVCDSWLANDHEILVVTIKPGGQFADALQEMHIEVLSLFNLRLWGRVRSFKPDIIQGWMYHANLAAMFLRMFVPYARLNWSIRQSLYSLRDEKPLSRLIIRLNAWFSRQPDRIIYNSQVSRTQHESLGFCMDSGELIYNGFDLYRCEAAMRGREATRQSLGLNNDEFVIIHVARLHPMKNHGLLCDVLNELDRRGVSYRAIMVGRGVSAGAEPFATRLSQAAVERCLFMGERADSIELIAAADCLCSTSAWGEGFPNVLGEALSCGVATVTTNVGDSESVVAGIGVVVSDPVDEQFADGVEVIRDLSEPDRFRVREMSQERARALFDIERIAVEYLGHQD